MSGEDYEERQEAEIEALRSMFWDEFEFLGKTERDHVFKVAIIVG